MSASLIERIRAEIGARGPVRLDRFWNLALFDPAEGYYATREPFGSAGDFVTAPEISQMFGELLGAWALAAWRELGAPSPFVFAEIGPGRGTLMADMLRTAARLDGAFLRAARVRLVETSDRLAALQLSTLSRFDLPVVRHRRWSEVEALLAIVVANEWLDAVAIRQLVFEAGAWRERFVAANADGSLRFRCGDALRHVPVALAALPAPQEGDVFEVSPERERLVAEMAADLSRRGGAALLVDYGHPAPGFGDTLQALRRHAFAEVLAEPGRADITSHVDFSALRAVAQAAGLPSAGLTTQGRFLLDLGLVERAGRLGASADESGRAALTAAVRRLAGDGHGEMGDLFKVLAIASAPLSLPPFEVATTFR
ncbi:class I SAM-dependent methyltransferase [Aureimonas pseudogalii]|uniref:SAM-dependent MidA family methyltransferase n=1 Tax=Aureimonas pseudogalii TaxID=1744844 RepID=A0A7W6H4R8_9HYPH|nr:SAM-dependent methyltransferase [Aureimonas pseudogalii]MBB3997924.1 SAM-dependent MidA family methyltransferase [Aureimonas pseudogalii]